MKKLKTVEECFEACGLDIKNLPDVSMLPADVQKAIIAHYKLMVVMQAHNEGWKPDWTNSSEYKYYPWFDMSSGSGLAFGVCVVWLARTVAGSRLCFKSKELAKHVGEQFSELYEEYFLYKE